MNTKIVVVFVLLLLVGNKVLACGGVLHNEIGKRALEFLDNEEISSCVFNFPEAFQSATIFPDWGYSFESTSDASEFSHWTEFSRLFAKLISQKYKKPWDEQAQRVVAFYIGVSLHSTTDVLWHDLSNVNLQIGQGFIRSQAEHIFNGDYRISHTVADIGGEFISSYESDTKYLRRLWYIPIEDILEVYRSANIRLTSDDIVKGSLLLYASTLAASELGHILYPITSISPFLQEQMYNFFSGGVDDMVHWTLECWNNSISLLDNLNTKPCSIFKEDGYFSHLSFKLASMPFWNKLVSALISQAEIKKTGKEVYIKFAPTQPVAITKEDIRELTSHLNVSNIEMASQLEHLFDDKKGGFEVNFEREYHYDSNILSNECLYIDKVSSTKITTNAKYAYLGSQVIYGNLTGKNSNDIIISAPGYSTKKNGWERGAVYIIPLDLVQQHNEISLDNPPSGVVQLLGQNKYERFGESIAVIDLNGDGIDDLAVSSPRFDANNLKYSGIISIYYGTKQGISLIPSVTIFSNTSYSNIGTELRGFDIDNDGKKDLIIGSPYSCNLQINCSPEDSNLQRGSVSIFLSSKWNEKVKSNRKINIIDSDWIQYGQSKYGLFGHKIEFIKSKGILAISAPTVLNDEDQARKGSVYGFLIKDILGSPINKPYWTIKGDLTLSKFGYDIAVGNPINKSSKQYLSVSMPTYSSVYGYYGAVKLINLDNMENMGTTYGSNYFSRFGWKTMLEDIDSDGNDDYLISEPWYNEQTGRLLVWKGGKEFDLARKADFCYTLSNMKHSLFGMNFNVHKSNDIAYIAISSPHYSENKEMSGAVFVINQ